MEIDSLLKSASFLQKYIEAEGRIKELEAEIISKDELILTLEHKLKAFTDNKQLKAYISGLENTVKKLQIQVEGLQIVSFTQKKADESSSPQDSQQVVKSLDPKPHTFEDAIQNEKVWKSLNKFLSGQEIVKVLFLSKKLNRKLTEIPQTFEKVLKEIHLPKSLPKTPIEIHGLLKK